MKYPHLTLIIGFICLISVFTAQAYTPRPDRCPSVASIQLAGLRFADQDTDGTWAAVQLSQYETPQMWGFAMINIQAGSAIDALTKARASLATLSGNPTPWYNAQDDDWGCLYTVGNGYLAAAITPIPFSALKRSIMRAK